MVIVRLAGGLGNQLFQYAAARRLALKNNVPLRIDAISGFERDYYYKRSYALKHFCIEADCLPAAECYPGTMGRGRRWLHRQISRRRPFEARSHIKEERPHCDSRLLRLKVRRKVYLEGDWQSVKYFEDIEADLRRDLRLREAVSPISGQMAERMEGCEAVCVHVRRFVTSEKEGGSGSFDRNPLHFNLGMDYYQAAIRTLLQKIEAPHFFIFSDSPEWAKEYFRLGYPSTFVDHNDASHHYEDLWLMSRCKHFIIANSSFSWWGAWLGAYPDRLVYAPSRGFHNTVDMMPETWMTV